MNPLLILACGMAVVITGILGLRMHAFLALIIGAFTVALLTPTDALRQFSEQKVAKAEWTAKVGEKFVDKPAATRVGEEFGRTCTNLGILIAMATILGEAMMRSGAAESIASTLLRLFGPSRAHWAFLTSAFVLCSLAMLDTVMYLVAPLFKAVARKTRRDYLLLVMATVAGGTITHSLVPPSPGPLFVAGELGVPIALMMGMGCLIGMGASSSGLLFAHFANRRTTIEIPEEHVEPEQASKGERVLPPLWISILPVAVPLILITLDSALAPNLEAGSLASRIVRNVGAKESALTIGALCALVPLAFFSGKIAASKAVGKALESGAAILLIIAAGGAFGGALQQTGIAGYLAAQFAHVQMLALPLVFLVTTLVRTAQGSATVAMITSAPIAKALIAGGAGVHPVYFAIAIGCGSKPFSWMNDAGFWIITRLSGMRESETLRTVSPMMAFQGIMGLVLTMLCAWLIPLK